MKTALITPTSGALVALLFWTMTCPTTTIAQPREDVLGANIDATVSPRDDFFQYANGGWFKRHPIPDGQAAWGIADVLSEEVDSQLRRISETAAARPAPRGSDEQLVGDFWLTGMDEATLNKQGLAPLQPDLDRIGRARSIADLIDLVASLHRRSFQPGRVLFVGRIDPDETDSSRWTFSLQQGGIMIYAPAAFTAADPRAVRAREAFRAYQLKTFLRLHGDPARAKASADAVYELIAQLAKGFEPALGRQKMSLEDLSRLAPTIDWGRYLRAMGYDPGNAVNMRSVRFFQTLDSQLRTVPLDTWKDYLRLFLVRMNVAFLDDATLEDYVAYDSATTGAARPRPRWIRVLTQGRNFTLGQSLARLYVKQYFPAPVIARYQGVADAMRAAFRNRIEQAGWIQNTTRQAALGKLARLNITIGFGDLSMDFSTMPISRDAYAVNVMRATEWLHEQNIKKLNRPVDKTASDPIPSWQSGEYSDHANAVLMSPGGLTVPPGWRVEDLDDAFVYGATRLGHEISHGYDSEGRYYDGDGNRADWWTAADAAAFVERSERLVDQYNAFMPLDGLHVDGRRSLRENMADVSGLRIALDAFKKTEQFSKGERVGGFTPLQRFFLAFAYGSMSQSRPEAIASQLQGNYAPYRERVNGPLMNIPEFYEAFGVKPGDRMYRPEGARATIW